MRVQQPVRNRNTSLQQSAIHQALASNEALSQEKKEQIEHNVSLHAQALHQPTRAATHGEGPKDVTGGDRSSSEDARVHPAAIQPDGNAVAHGPLINLFRTYSVWDVGWLRAGWLYFKYYVIAHLPPTYRNWKGYVVKDLDYGVVKYRLPPNSRVLMIGDWGTHMPDNVALLRQAITKFKPDAIIHLGDVYYSGTVEECKENVLDVMDQIFSDPSLGLRPPFFTIPGNHDYYSGGGGFYHTIDNINSGITNCKQEASYFCLRTEDDKWQFLGMDTGYNDRVPTDQLTDAEGPDLHQNEGEWQRDKLDKFSGSTILLSHHQLVSAKEQLSKGERPYLNEKLYKKFSPYFDRISVWYWGHEHNLILFEDNLRIDRNGPVLKGGRLLGCSAYEENVGEDPFARKYTDVRFIAGMPQLGRSNFKTGGQSFYNHAFAILDVAPEKITATYYEYPSWGLDNKPPSEPKIPDGNFHQEELRPTR
jgi:hypothetical protein